MGLTNSNKEINVEQIECGGSFTVRLSLSAEPDITSNPTDIVLILDRSGSMSGSPLANLKSGAKKFIDIIDEATDGTSDGQIGGGSRIAIVSFADSATQDTQLITSVADLKAAIDALSAGGSTNHEDAFANAVDLLSDPSTNAKVMVMFTDGVTTTGGDPAPIATAAKANGTIIYAIGLSGSGGVDESALEDWASEPSSAYVAITPDDAELEQIFEDLAENIVNPGATDIVLTDIVAPCFTIGAISSPTKGSATLVDSNTVRWNIDELGVTSSEGAVFEFTVNHTGSCTGETAVNESVTYTDNEGNVATFPSPTVDIQCDVIVNPEPCPTSVDFEAVGCSDTIEFDAGDIEMQSMGRIVQVDATIRNVCPLKRVALAVLLYEVDENDIEYQRGLKMMTIPAHDGDSCRDVTVKCIKFVLPEDLNVSGDTDSICPSRNLRVKFISHYIDNDYACCNEVENGAR